MLEVYSTLTRQKKEFKPIKSGKINMYVCGPTVYGPGHIGHARTYVAFDIIRRYLEFKGFDVKFVVNITDVHDDMIKEANKQGITIFQLAEKNIKLFFEDMQRLGVKKADVNPRVTEVIPEIIEMTMALEKKGIAYETDDGVYYSISKFPSYGKLSNIKLEQSVTGTRVETDKYEKESAMDFALWKKAKPNEPSWPSPWGEGRPGWHIECSVMSAKFLGEQFDIHGGAVDLIFPHHENEIAQSEACFGKAPFVKYWFHTGFLNVDGEKMSKSLGNFIIIPELLDKYDPKSFRFFIADVHYRSRIDFSEESMRKAKNSLEKLNNFIQLLYGVESDKDNTEVVSLIKSAMEEFIQAMDNDFNSPLALAAIFEFVKKINTLIAEENLSKENALEVIDFMKEIDKVYNMLDLGKEELQLDKELLGLIEKREKFRKSKNWKEADKIRDQLHEKGVELLDTPTGVKWKKISE